ncbi:unnamed protein product, partial [Phaeothamnion confervicola]
KTSTNKALSKVYLCISAYWHPFLLLCRPQMWVSGGCLAPADFDVLPFGLFRRLCGFLDRADFAVLAAVDRHRLVVAYCVWERRKEPFPGNGGRFARVSFPVYRFRSADETDAGTRGCRTALVSYPRSGNTLLRRLLESVTGVVTGSDTRPDRTLSRSLTALGMQGEGVVDARVSVVKTHYPERHGYRRFRADRAIVLVRNPFDAIDSYFNMALTNTHDKSLHDSVYSDFADLWDGMVRNEASVWHRFHRHWLAEADAPAVVVRYEDLLRTPLEALRRVLSFL